MPPHRRGVREPVAPKFRTGSIPASGPASLLWLGPVPRTLSSKGGKIYGHGTALESTPPASLLPTSFLFQSLFTGWPQHKSYIGRLPFGSVCLCGGRGRVRKQTTEG